MIDFKQILNIIKFPVAILFGLTCVGVILNNMITNLIIIIAMWAFVLGLCALSAMWNGFQAAKKNLSINESGIAGAITWLIPGTIGLVIVGINQFISALLWGSIEGYEAIAFIVGCIVIVICLVIGSVLYYIAGVIGGFIGKNK